MCRRYVCLEEVLHTGMTMTDLLYVGVVQFLANVVRWLPGKDLGAQLRRCKNKGIVKSCIRGGWRHGGFPLGLPMEDEM